MESKLFQHLHKSYGGFADRRHKILSPGQRIRVDDGTDQDRSSDFCWMFVSVDERDQIHLQISNLPMDDDVRKCLNRLGADFANLFAGNRIELIMTKDWGPHLKRLATVVRRVVGRGRRYSNPNWKWVAPRAAGSLERLAEVLDDFNPPRAKSRNRMSTAIRKPA